MDSEALSWTVEKKETLLHTPVFDVEQREALSESGLRGSYYALRAPDWVVVIPVLGQSFVLVRQFRHGLGAFTTEFPGGVVKAGEAPEKSAERELLEETGFKAGKITVLGRCNPNPALFSNEFTVCLAEDLTDTQETHPDEDEFIRIEKMPIDRVIDGFCSGELIHAFMGTALALYLRHKAKKS